MKKLEIQTVGTPGFPRFIISSSDGEVFDGTAWTKDRDRAVLFTNGQTVAVTFNALQEQMYLECPLREFTVPLTIRVRSVAPFTQQELEQYMDRATSIFLDHHKGTGPVENSMVQVGVTWREMREKVSAEEQETG